MTAKQEVSPVITESEDLLQARCLLAALLATSLRDPRNRSEPLPGIDPELLTLAWDLACQAFPDLDLAELSLGELQPRDVDPSSLGRWLAQTPDTTERIYRTIFGFVVARDCPPYETEFCHWNDPTYRAHQMADVSAFYRAFGLQPDEARPDRVDHVSTEIDFVAHLLQRLVVLMPSEEAPRTSETDDRRRLVSDALNAFLKDHLCWWVPTFAGTLERRIDAILHEGVFPGDLPAWLAIRDVARFLRAWVAFERVVAGVQPVRQIISPQVAPLPPQDEEESTCGECDSCAQPEFLAASAALPSDGRNPE